MITPVSGASAGVSVKFDDLKSNYSKKDRLAQFQDRFYDALSGAITEHAQENDQAQSESQQTSSNKYMNKSGFADLSDKLKEILKDANMYLEFSKDKETNKIILKLIDQETGEVVEQYPEEVSLKIARYISATLGNGQVTNATV